MSRKIIFVNASLTDGGSEKVMGAIASQLAELGLDITMILVRDKKRTYDISPKIKCIQLANKKSNMFFNLIKRVIAIRHIVKNSEADTVVSFMTDMNILTILSCFNLKKKVIISERAHPLLGKDSKSKKPFYARILINLLYPLADRVVFQTEYAMNCYPNKVRKKGVIIPNPVPLNLPDVHRGTRKKVIVAAGRLTKQKNFKLLIRAFGEVAKSHPDYKLIIYGNGPMLAELETLVSRLRLSGKVMFPGYVTDLADSMKDAAMYVSSSDYEGISNAMLEAMALGLPSVCTDCPVGGAALVIKNNCNGLLVPVGNARELRDAMVKILENPEFGNMLSQNSVHVREDFGILKISRLWLKVIECNS